jgi:uncharacterized protein (TIGR03663 family)
MNKTAFCGLFLIVLAGAILFRVVGLELRPMHHDEANQALKFGALLEKGEYRYDKSEHHGPSLYYLSLPFAWALSKKTLASLDEVTLRLVPAFFGAGIILLMLIFLKPLKREALLFAALFATLSPAMAYFSRFYIQEMLLIFFFLGFLASVWRYVLHPSKGWAFAAGFFAGMMYVTKETSVIALGAVAGAFLFTLFFRGKTRSLQKPLPRVWSWHLFLALASAIIISSLLFSSFFHNPQGLLDSIRSFKLYFVRSGEAGWHSHPWCYYLKLLAFNRSRGGPIWSEALILVLALVGSFVAFKDNSSKNSSLSFPKFVFFYSLLSTTIYSLIPYKTPWNLLSFYMGFLFLAGIGAAFLLKVCRKSYQGVVFLSLLGIGLLNLGMQSFQANFRLYADPRNPYVYAQTSPDFLRLVKRIDDLASHHPERKQMLIKVICSPYETWPLPWYLRAFGRVGYWQGVEGSGGFEGVSVIISSQENAEKLERYLGDKYQSAYYELRPGVLLVLYVQKDLWEKFLRERI